MSRHRAIRSTKVDSARRSETPKIAEDLLWGLRNLVKKEAPTPKDIEEVAFYFDRYAKSALEDAGYAPTRTAVAAIVGETVEHYLDVVNGRKGSVLRVLSWVMRWMLAMTPEETFFFGDPSLVQEFLMRPEKKAASAKTREKRKKPAGGFTPEKLEELRLMGITLSQNPGGGES
jgi:hypothetical protein